MSNRSIDTPDGMSSLPAKPRILVVGTSSAGKSTLADALSRALKWIEFRKPAETSDWLQGAGRAAAPSNGRRTAVLAAVSFLVASSGAKVRAQAGALHPELRWYEAAAQMKRLAQSWQDQPYGAVLVLDGAIIGEGPSRVVRNNDVTAHAEREAIRDASRRLGRQELAGAVLYSTSRPCSLCEAAAAQAGVTRMYFGPLLIDAGVPGRSAG